MNVPTFLPLGECLHPLNNYKLLNKASIPWSLDSVTKHALKNSARVSYIAGIICDVVAPSSCSHGHQGQKVTSESRLLAMTSQVHGNVSKRAQIQFAVRAEGFVRFLWRP